MHRILVVVLTLLCLSAHPAQAVAGERQAGLQAETYHEVARTWRRFVELLDKDDFDGVLMRVDTLDAVRRANGLPNLFDAAVALSRAALQRVDAGDPDMGFHLARSAASLAPALPAPQYAMAATSFAQDRNHVFAAIGYIAHGWLKEFSYLPSQLALASRLAATLLFAYVALLLLFSVSQLWRHLRPLSHDVSHLFPKGVSSFQAGLFILIVLLSPLYAGLGLVSLFLLWAVAPWWYQSRPEKVLTLLLVVGALTLPALSLVHSRSLAFFTGPLADAERCLAGNCSATQVQGLETGCDNGGEAACLALAVVRSRQGAHTPPMFDDALRALEPLRAWDGHRGALVDNLLGNTLQAKAVADCARRERQGGTGPNEAFRALGLRAVAAYERAAAGGLRGTADFNRSLMLLRLGDTTAADEARRRALDAGGARVRHASERLTDSDALPSACDTLFNPNELLIVDLPSLRSEVVASLLPIRLHGIRLPLLHGPLLGGLGMRSFIGVVGGAFALILLFALLKRFVRPSWRCVQCGRVGCARCREELTFLDICEECLFIQVKGSFVDAKELWFRERSVQQRSHARQRSGRLLSFFVPGLGHLLRGRPIAGALLLSTMTVALLNATGAACLAPDLSFVPHGAEIASQVLWTLLAVVTYVVSIVSIYRGK